MTGFVDAHRGQFGVEPICTVIEFSVSTYYAAKKREDFPSDRELRDEELVPLIREVWEAKGKRLYGARKVWRQLRRDGVVVARCAVERLIPFFQCRLWLQADCCGHVLWAYNLRHLDYLRAYVAADLRD